MKHPMPTAPKTLKILRALNKGERLTSLRGALRHGVFAVGRECSRLRELGWPIADRWITTKGGAHVKEYMKGWA